MEIFGKMNVGGRGSASSGEIGIYIHKDNTVNIVLRKKEILKYERMLLGFEDGKMYLICGEGDPKSIKVSSDDHKNCSIRTKNPDIYNRLKDCEGEYEALWDKTYKDWYITLNKKEVK